MVLLSVLYETCIDVVDMHRRQQNIKKQTADRSMSLKGHMGSDKRGGKRQSAGKPADMHGQ